MRSLKEFFWFSVDVLFPLAEPLSKQERAEQAQREKDRLDIGTNQIAALPSDPPILSGYLDKCLKLLEDERDRRQGVENRLTTVMGLCSIAGTVVFGGIVAEATGTVHTQSAFLQWGIALGALYLTLQLCSAILAAVRGLGRRSYDAGTSEVALPEKGEDQADHKKRQMQWCLETLAGHRAHNNAKVTQMAVAHRAIANFLFALILVALLGTGYAVRQHPSNDAVETLRRNHELSDLLRGPQGPAGPKGEAGSPCKTPSSLADQPPLRPSK